MQGELERLGEPSDRDRRERLEQVQAELRSARLELAQVDDSAARRLAEVQAALDAAKARKAAALARAQALEAEQEEREQRVEWLERQLKEEELLAKGARQLGYREWRTPGSYAKWGSLIALFVASIVGIITLAPWLGVALGLVLLAALIVATHFTGKKKRKGR